MGPPLLLPISLTLLIHSLLPVPSACQKPSTSPRITQLPKWPRRFPPLPLQLPFPITPLGAPLKCIPNLLKLPGGPPRRAEQRCVTDPCCLSDPGSAPIHIPTRSNLFNLPGHPLVLRRHAHSFARPVCLLASSWNNLFPTAGSLFVVYHLRGATPAPPSQISSPSLSLTPLFSCLVHALAHCPSPNTLKPRLAERFRECEYLNPPCESQERWLSSLLWGTLEMGATFLTREQRAGGFGYSERVHLGKQDWKSAIRPY